jgi:hypothetical protein
VDVSSPATEMLLNLISSHDFWYACIIIYTIKIHYASH